MDQNSDMPRIDVRDRRGQEHEQQDEPGRQEDQPTDLGTDTGRTITAHSTANRAEAFAEGALHRCLLDWPQA
jgi:hypothetical protein